jgi:hypothetical protein
VPERPEILSTARPSATRLWGFLCLVGGALLAGLGATRDWAVVGFPGDATGTLDGSVKGTDVWEGKVVLAAAVLALVVLVAARLVRATETRRILAFGIATLGALVLALALSVAVRADARFGGAEGLDDVAANLAKQLDQDPAAIRAQLEQRFDEQLRVDQGSGIWLTLAGGLLIDVGGAVTLAWARRAGGGSEASAASRRSEAPPGGPADPGETPADPA